MLLLALASPSVWSLWGGCGRFPFFSMRVWLLVPGQSDMTGTPVPKTYTAVLRRPIATAPVRVFDESALRNEQATTNTAPWQTPRIDFIAHGLDTHAGKSVYVLDREQFGFACQHLGRVRWRLLRQVYHAAPLRLRLRL